MPSSTVLTVSIQRSLRATAALVVLFAAIAALLVVASPPADAQRPAACAGLDTVGGCTGQTRGRGPGPYSVALMVSNAGSLTPLEQSLTAMLQGRGHTVTPFTVTARPIVNARNNTTIDLLLFSPSFEFSMLYHPAQRHALPMLDMTKWSWYSRYVLPWNDDIAGPRFSDVSDSSRRVHYENAGVIPWDRRVGPARVMRATRYSGGAPMRRAIDHSTGGDAQYFLRHTSDRGARSTIGVYLPAGSTVTKPAPTRAEERRRTSRAPWVGLLLFNDDPSTDYTQLTPAGRALFDAAMARLMNP